VTGTAAPPRHGPAGATLHGDALRAERLGHWDQAAGLFARAFRAGVLRGAAEEAVDALRGQARIRLQQARHDEAEELADLSRVIARAHGLGRAVARATNVIALVRYAVQDFASARALHEAALDLAVDEGDDELIGMACLNLGVVSSLQGDLRGARVRFLESIGSSVRSGDKRGELMAYNNLGALAGLLQEWLEAQVYLDRGIEIAERIGDSAQLARLSLNRAEALLQLGDHLRARDALALAQARVTAVRDGVVAADVLRLWGMLARDEGDAEEARSRFRQALELSAAAGTPYKRAETLREWALLHRAAGDEPRAQGALAEARALFAELGSTHEVARVDVLARNPGGAQKLPGGGTRPAPNAHSAAAGAGSPGASSARP
jgi:tetratricopeptide (TPR) repeat protein